MIGTIIVFAALLVLLVMVHEFGHFVVARRTGCRVEEFGFGFPPRVFSWMRGGTRYSLNLLPIGGFVKIEGEDMQESTPGPTSFGSKTAGQRTAILVAGVTMNVILTYGLLTIQALIGFPTVQTAQNGQDLTDLKTYIVSVAPNTPAAMAGLQDFDRIVAVAGTPTGSLEDVQAAIARQRGEDTTIEIERQGAHLTLPITPRLDQPAEEGPLGVSLASTGLKREAWWKAPWIGLVRTGQMLGAIVVQFTAVIQRLAASGTLGEALTGPVGIAIYTKEATQLGLSYLLEFGALISLNLALINILPFPALDGGRIVFIAIEKIRGQRLPERFEHATHTIGFAALLVLMALITWRDIVRFF